MTKVTMLRLPDKTAEKIQKMANKKGIPFATCAKELICERISKIKMTES
jgi:predicted DNA-binding protein